MLGTSAASGAAQQPLDWELLGDQGVELLQQYVRLKTVNPPGDEGLAVEFLAATFDAEGIEYQVLVNDDGRANLIARLRGDGSGGGAVVLLNHTDVVPVTEEFWSVDPFGGEIRDGRLYGRGVTDMKGDGIVQLVAMLALHRSGSPLSRDVIYMATAGEETGGSVGAGFLVERLPELIADIDFVITEGGSASRIGNRTVHFVETTQKTPLWLRLRATGLAGHGSRAIQDSAANRLVRALDRIRTYRPQLRLVPSVVAAIHAAAEIVVDADQAADMRDIERTIADPVVLQMLERQYGPLLRNTVAITVMRGSAKTNVISPEAMAELDCRLLPGESADLFLATLREVIDDESIQIETILRFTESASPADTELWRAIESAAKLDDAAAVVLPLVLGGFTDSHYFREQGIVAYGWSPLVKRPGDGPAHGVDEKVSVAAVRRAPRVMFDMLSALVVRQPTE